jgi:hypothetical protein
LILCGSVAVARDVGGRAGASSGGCGFRFCCFGCAGLRLRDTCFSRGGGGPCCGSFYGGFGGGGFGGGTIIIISSIVSSTIIIRTITIRTIATTTTTKSTIIRVDAFVGFVVAVAPVVFVHHAPAAVFIVVAVGATGLLFCACGVIIIIILLASP